ncbi:helix-turn-helix domain-containing protein [Aneurinibacillus aneurinilyticus]|uniref:helix-turn-helix domain-containing protein n=1 Tax=Aneurinibacillus aneurinilyticus TaxID=1391 RepID=UPI0023F3CC05|nr:helix-turn-helix transcriptional regulator [Aneurinibacillus aneurinilyticus]
MLGNRLSNLRKLNNLTQSEVAKKIGVSRSAYANYESGNREPDYETLQKISSFYEVSVDYLLGKVDERNKQLREAGEEAINAFVKEKMDNIYNLLHNLPLEEQKELLRQLGTFARGFVEERKEERS